MIKPALAALALALVAGTAQAALAPQYYQQARDEAPDVIVVDVGHVGIPAGVWGACNVEGKVHQVERGTRYRNGQAVRLPVPCKTPKAQVPAGGTVWQAMGDLKPGIQARAWLNAEGGLALDQFEVLR